MSNRLLTADEVAADLLDSIERHTGDLSEPEREAFYEAVIAYLYQPPIPQKQACKGTLTP